MSTLGDPLPLETPEGLDRAMRIIYARRSGNDEFYRAELARVFDEILDEAMAAGHTVGGDPGEDIPLSREWTTAYFQTLNLRASQLVHALVRTANMLADARAVEHHRSAEDLLNMVDDVLRGDDAGHS